MTAPAPADLQALRTAYAQQIATVRAAARLLEIPPALLDEVALQAFVMAHGRGEDLSQPEAARARMVALTRRVAEWYREELPPGVGDAPLAITGGSALFHFLAGLSQQHREIFVLGEVGALKVPEISAELGISFDVARMTTIELVRDFAVAMTAAGAEEVIHDLQAAMQPTPAELELQLAALTARLTPQAAPPPAPEPEPPQPAPVQWAVPSILRGTGLVDEPPAELAASARPTVITGGPDGRMPPRPPGENIGAGPSGQVIGALAQWAGPLGQAGPTAGPQPPGTGPGGARFAPPGAGAFGQPAPGQAPFAPPPVQPMPPPGAAIPQAPLGQPATPAVQPMPPPGIAIPQPPFGQPGQPAVQPMPPPGAALPPLGQLAPGQVPFAPPAPPSGAALPPLGQLAPGQVAFAPPAPPPGSAIPPSPGQAPLGQPPAPTAQPEPGAAPGGSLVAPGAGVLGLVALPAVAAPGSFDAPSGPAIGAPGAVPQSAGPFGQPVPGDQPAIAPAGPLLQQVGAPPVGAPPPMSGPGPFGQAGFLPPVGQPGPHAIGPVGSGQPPGGFVQAMPPGVPMPAPLGSPQMAPGPGPFGQPQMPVAPPGPRSIVADLDVSETSLKARPERLVPRSTALTVVSVLVLAVAGGGGYWAWRAQQQVEPEIEAPVEVAPPPAEPPEEPPIFEEPPPMGPELPPPPATDTKTGKGGKTESTKTGGDAGGKSSKSGSGSKSDSSGKTGNKDGATKGSTGGGSKKSDPVEGGADPYAKRKEKAEGADPGRVLVELEYLSAIDKALKARNWAQALAYIDQHDRELPGGQLVDKFDERRIRAMCGMGRVAEAKTKAQQILTKRPNSLVKNALAEACK